MFYPLAPRLANEKGRRKRREAKTVPVEREKRSGIRERVRGKKATGVNYEGDWYKGLGRRLEIMSEGGSDVFGWRRWSSHVV